VSKLVEWDTWYCPHPDCEDGRGYDDPESITETSCDKGHHVKLVWRENGHASPRLVGRRHRHNWLAVPGGWFCLNCTDKKRGIRAPVFGCAYRTTTA